jgi:hypothetical protein
VEVRLPQHIVNWIERRGQRGLGRRRNPERSGPGVPGRGSDDPIRSPKVRRLLEGSLRPPKSTELRLWSAAFTSGY